MEQEITIKRVSFGLTIDDKRYPVDKPNMKKLKSFTAKQKMIEKKPDHEEELVDSSLEFLSSLGLPIEVVENLDPEMLEDITKIVTGQKKS